ncbi:MAG TPA: TasA family protein [Actinomycetota bacterium]|nr:TasA family protein [Actinomycetota bacterium]
MRKIWIALLAVGVVAGAPWALTHAIFTDSQAVGSNAFSTGNVDISSSPTSALVSFSAMAPGDKVTAPITISNAGSLELRYAMTTSISGSTTLSDGLTLAIKSGVTTCTNNGFGTDGSSVYSGSLTAGAIGDATQGSQGGDRTLNASGSEILCFQVSLPISAADSLQGLSATATFTFSAEQTANN